MKIITARSVRIESNKLLAVEGGFFNLIKEEYIKKVIKSHRAEVDKLPLFSVIVPTYNKCELLMETLNSLVSQNFPHDNFEIIVVDDGSTDRTYETTQNFVGQNPELRVFSVTLKKNLGPSFARNYGIKFAAGNLIAFTDDDCVIPSDWLRGFKEKFAAHAGLVGAGGWKTVKEGQRTIFEKFIYWRRMPYMMREFLSVRPNPFNNCGDTANVCYRKDVLINAGGFNPYFRYLEDWELKMRIHSKNLLLLYFPRMVLHEDKIDLTQFTKHELNFGRELRIIQMMYPGCLPVPDSFTGFLAAGFRESITVLFSEKGKFYFIFLVFFMNFLRWLGRYKVAIV